MSRPLPLAGITVLDLGQIYQGPYAGFLLAMAGARVIKVEPLAGESLRSRGPSLPLAMLNSCKESVTVDLKHPDGVALFKRLVAKADVVLVNYAPGVPERLGIGFEQLSEVNDRLVYAHGSGFGVRGLDGEVVDSSVPAMDITVQAHTGAMSLTGNEGEPPLKAGVAYIDFLGGTHLYGAVTTALFERERTGIGRSVESSMADAAYFPLSTALGQWHAEGFTRRSGNRHAQLSLAPYNVYRCADGHVAMMAVNNRHWRSVLSAMGRDDLHADTRYTGNAERVERMDEVDALVESWTSTLSRAEVARALQDAHVPAAAVREVDEVVRDQSQHERKAMQWMDHPQLGEVPLPHSPIRWHGSDLIELVHSPSLGANNRTVYKELAGLDDDAVDQLVADGVVVEDSAA
ncbi:MAG: CoA:oxalate CoA-transferase [Acidimicrobiales bacterium]|jgi:CoA:oxalate CoA-transferase